jgi:hypothetical protein
MLVARPDYVIATIMAELTRLQRAVVRPMLGFRG